MMTRDFLSSRTGNTDSTVSPKDFADFREFLESACGIHLSDNKQYLVSTRVRRILMDNQLPNLGALVDALKQGRNSQLRELVVDAMTTNETFWFRDNYPYDALSKTIFPELSKAREHGSVRIWSAACSSGQEPYSISMIAEESRSQPNGLKRQVEIVATDLSPSMLEQARKAEYDRLSITRGLSEQRRSQFFEPAGKDLWRVKSGIRNRVSFRPANLMHNFNATGRFDIIFCRNVLIYFTADLKQDILRRMHGALKPGGILFLGSSEGVSGVSELFEMVHASPAIFYRAK